MDSFIHFCSSFVRTSSLLLFSSSSTINHPWRTGRMSLKRTVDCLRVMDCAQQLLRSLQRIMLPHMLSMTLVCNETCDIDHLVQTLT